jgi:hypothetical protein
MTKVERDRLLKAMILVNTSKFENLPKFFLQASVEGVNQIFSNLIETGFLKGVQQP